MAATCPAAAGFNLTDQEPSNRTAVHRDFVELLGFDSLMVLVLEGVDEMIALGGDRSSSWRLGAPLLSSTPAGLGVALAALGMRMLIARYNQPLWKGRTRCGFFGGENRWRGISGAKEHTPVKGASRAEHRRPMSMRLEERARAEWSALEQHSRGKMQEGIQDLLEEETTEVLGGNKSERR
jgi:hypothetical protein